MFLLHAFYEFCKIILRSEQIFNFCKVRVVIDYRQYLLIIFKLLIQLMEKEDVWMEYPPALEAGYPLHQSQHYPLYYPWITLNFAGPFIGGKLM